MNSIGTVLYASGGSRLSVSNVNVSGNSLLAAFTRKIASDFTQQTSRNFNVLLADSSQASGNGFIVADNNGMDVSWSTSCNKTTKISKESMLKSLNFLVNSVYSVQVMAVQFQLQTYRSRIATGQV